MNTRTLRRLTAAMMMVSLAAGCREQPDDQQTGSLSGEAVQAVRADWPEGVAVQVDSGNDAYTAKDYERARRHYDEALRLAGDMKAPRVTAYFGLYMVEHAVGDTAAARAAMEQAQALAPEASLIHGMPADSARKMAPPTPQDSIHQRPRN